MAETNVKITFEIDGLEQSVTSIDDAKKALAGLEDQAKKTEKTVDDVGKATKDLGDSAKEAGEASEGAIKVVDEVTGGLGTKVKEVGGGLKAMGKQAITAFKGAVQGANAMGKALIATGIGAIVVAVGLLVAYWDDIKGLVSGVSAEQAKLLEDTQATADAAAEQLAATEASENSLRLQGKSEREIRDLKIQQTDEVIAATEQVLIQQREQLKAQIDAQERNKKIAQNVIRFLTLPLTAILKTVDLMTAAISKIPGINIETNLEEGFSGGLANLIFDPEETATEGQATIAETEKTLAQLKNKRDGFILANQKADQDARDKAKAEREKEAAAAAAAAEKAAAAAKAAEEKRLAEEEKLRQQAIANREFIDGLLQQANLDAIDDQFARARAELEIQKQTDLEKLAAAGATEEEINRIKDAYARKRMQIDQEEADFKDQLRQADIDAALGAASQIFGTLSGLLAEGSAGAKAAAIAQTTIDTYQSATAAYKSVVGIPVVGPALAPVAAGVAIAAGLANIKKIVSTKVPGDKGSAGAPTISAPAIQSYDPNAALAQGVGGQQGNQITLGQQAGSTGAPIVKAYVVSSDMTSQQEKDKKINDLARL